MHIPDGYLSPQTTIPAMSLMLVVWYISLKKIKKLPLNKRTLIALCAAFDFVIMMFNIPVMGGSSVHAVGAVLTAILIGPWAAVLALSTAIVIQALLFGDGGIFSLGVNCLNMAVIMPFSGYLIYKLIAYNSVISSRRHMFAVFIASFIGVNFAAFMVAIEMGIQPILFHDAHNIPLYGFYGLKVTIPAMMLAHLFIAGPIEGIISVLVVQYVYRFNSHLFTDNLTQENVAIVKPRYFIYLLVFLAVLSPLGLLANGTAFGEWGTDEINKLIGYVPSGIQHGSRLWQALFPDYSLSILPNNGFIHSAFGYILSSIIGMLTIALLIWLSLKVIKQNKL